LLLLQLLPTFYMIRMGSQALRLNFSILGWLALKLEPKELRTQ